MRLCYTHNEYASSLESSWHYAPQHVACAQACQQWYFNMLQVILHTINIAKQASHIASLPCLPMQHVPFSRLLKPQSDKEFKAVSLQAVALQADLHIHLRSPDEHWKAWVQTQHLIDDCPHKREL